VNGAITGATKGAMKGTWPDATRSRGAHDARAVKRFCRSRTVALQDGFCKMDTNFLSINIVVDLNQRLQDAGEERFSIVRYLTG
jgi:hypothetical protein